MLPITQLQKLSARDQSLVIYPRSQSVRASVLCYFHMCFPGGSAVSPGEGNGHPLRYSFLENSMDIGAWWATVHGVTKSWTQLSHFHFSLSCIGEGNGNPLQCSCLENPRDGGAWWAAVYGVAQSRT